MCASANAINPAVFIWRDPAIPSSVSGNTRKAFKNQCGRVIHDGLEESAAGQLLCKYQGIGNCHHQTRDDYGIRPERRAVENLPAIHEGTRRSDTVNDLCEQEDRPPCAVRIQAALAIDNSAIFAPNAIMPARRAARTRNGRVLLIDTTAADLPVCSLSRLLVRFGSKRGIEMTVK